MSYGTLSGDEDGSSAGRIIIKMIAGRIGGEVEKNTDEVSFFLFMDVLNLQKTI